MNTLFAHKIWGIPWLVLAALALVVAVVYLAWDLSGDKTGWQWFVARWFHALCWLLLALAALARTRLTPIPAHAAGPLAMAGGLVYLAYIAAGLFG